MPDSQSGCFIFIFTQCISKRKLNMCSKKIKYYYYCYCYSTSIKMHLLEIGTDRYFWCDLNAS